MFFFIIDDFFTGIMYIRKRTGVYMYHTSDTQRSGKIDAYSGLK